MVLRPGALPRRMVLRPAALQFLSASLPRGKSHLVALQFLLAVPRLVVATEVA